MNSLSPSEREELLQLGQVHRARAHRRLGQGSGDYDGVRFVGQISGRHWNAFRWGLLGDLSARVEPLTVRFKPEAKAFKARERAYSPIKTAWLATCIGNLVGLGLVFRNLHTMWACAAMAAPKKGGFRLVSDYRAVYKQIAKVPSVMPNQEAEMVDILGAHVLGSLTCCKDIGRCRWRPKPRKCSPSLPRWSVHPHACSPRRFERDRLLRRCDNRIVGRLELQGLG